MRFVIPEAGSGTGPCAQSQSSRPCRGQSMFWFPTPSRAPVWLCPLERSLHSLLEVSLPSYTQTSSSALRPYLWPLDKTLCNARYLKPPMTPLSLLRIGIGAFFPLDLILCPRAFPLHPRAVPLRLGRKPHPWGCTHAEPVSAYRDRGLRPILESRISLLESAFGALWPIWALGAFFLRRKEAL